MIIFSFSGEAVRKCEKEHPDSKILWLIVSCFAQNDDLDIYTAGVQGGFGWGLGVGGFSYVRQPQTVG